ncbi:MAG: hypothetical protein QXN57_04810 [Desulfurococcaceae archaeon]
MSFINVDNELRSKYCREGNVCFWATVALINPYETNNLYVFDCSMYTVVKKEYADKHESRLLLSFKIPFELNEIYFGSKLDYRILPANTSCLKSDIEKYIESLLANIRTSIDQTHEKLSKMPKRGRFLRFLVPIRDESERVKGEYYGLLTKESMIREMISIIGYEGRVLKANVRNAHILISVDPSKQEFHGLLLNKNIKLNAYRKLIDIPLLLKTLGY